MGDKVIMPTGDWIAALNAARAKSGVTKKLLSGELAGVILGIETGIEPSGTKEITANGMYDVKNYASAQVDVPETEPVIKPLSVTENGTYTAPEGVNGYSPVTVNVLSDDDNRLISTSGETTALPIATGLSEIKYLVIYKSSVSSTGLIQGVYSMDTGDFNVVACLNYSQYVKSLSVAAITPTIDGGTFTYTPPQTYQNLNGTYLWIAVGKA